MPASLCYFCCSDASITIHYVPGRWRIFPRSPGHGSALARMNGQPWATSNITAAGPCSRSDPSSPKMDCIETVRAAVCRRNSQRTSLGSVNRRDWWWWMAVIIPRRSYDDVGEQSQRGANQPSKLQACGFRGPTCRYRTCTAFTATASHPSLPLSVAATTIAAPIYSTCC